MGREIPSPMIILLVVLVLIASRNAINVFFVTNRYSILHVTMIIAQSVVISPQDMVIPYMNKVMKMYKKLNPPTTMNKTQRKLMVYWISMLMMLF